MSNVGEVDRLYQELTTKLRSAVQNQDEESLCLVQFHNCTPYRVIPYWIDFKGQPVHYPALPVGASISINTYIAHLWFFKAVNPDKSRQVAPNYSDNAKVLAVPEDTLISCGYPLDKNPVQVVNEFNNPLRNAILVANRLICRLCKFVLKHHSIAPEKIPCPHFTGEARFSNNNVDSKTLLSYNSTYIYSCNEETHRHQHAIKRRDIYLVEPFYNLKERCFFALRDRIKSFDIVELGLPISLQREYLQFIITLMKLDGKKVGQDL